MPPRHRTTAAGAASTAGCRAPIARRGDARSSGWVLPRGGGGGGCSGGSVPHRAAQGDAFTNRSLLGRLSRSDTAGGSHALTRSSFICGGAAGALRGGLTAGPEHPRAAPLRSAQPHRGSHCGCEHHMASTKPGPTAAPPQRLPASAPRGSVSPRPPLIPYGNKPKPPQQTRVLPPARPRSPSPGRRSFPAGPSPSIPRPLRWTLPPGPACSAGRGGERGGAGLGCFPHRAAPQRLPQRTARGTQRQHGTAGAELPHGLRGSNTPRAPSSLRVLRARLDGALGNLSRSLPTQSFQSSIIFRAP